MMRSKVLSLDNAVEKHTGLQDCDFALDHRDIWIRYGQDRLRPGRLFALPLEEDLGCRGIERRLPHQDRYYDHENQSGDRRRELPLAPHKTEDLAQVKRGLSHACLARAEICGLI